MGERVRERTGGRRAEERTEMKGAGRSESDGVKGKERCGGGALTGVLPLRE